ncbi:MAG: hypothetical protein JRJ80_13760 [Deltaproteobacteria bacterium]|nr:hypothetical protein [Deltaproteobacteria bacterium]
MRYLFGLLCVCALGMCPLAACSGTGGEGGSGGSAGDGGSGGDEGTGGSAGTDVIGCDFALCDGVECDDGNLCTRDVCDVADGTCIHVATCDDFNDCTTEMCDPADESCSTPSPVADGTQCEGGTCRAGACELAGTVLPCTEQGIRNAIAAGDGTYIFACDGTTPVVTQAEIEIDNDVILDGEGKLTVDGNCEHRVFSVPEMVTVELRDFVITGGATPGEGGGIRNLGTLTVTNTTVYGNTGDYNGGGIESDGTLTLTNSTVSGNRGGSGGGIYVGHSGILTVTNSTLSGNTTDSCGGGIDVDGAAALVNSTVSGNISNGCADELFNQGFLVLVGSIVSGDADQNCSGVTSLGYNIESPLDTCGFDQATDHVNLSAEALALGPLQDNGGLTETHALGAGSVAIDQIPSVDCKVTTDQRGEPRPFPGGTMCDVGAFEWGRCASDDDCDDDDHCTDDVCDPTSGICDHSDWCI